MDVVDLLVHEVVRRVHEPVLVIEHGEENLLEGVLGSPREEVSHQGYVHAVGDVRVDVDDRWHCSLACDTGRFES